jgi:AhpD family alkylhydroperoxidase
MERRFFKKFYSVPELYVILVRGLRTMPFLAKSRSTGGLSSGFTERIMLAVTEVNGCEVCSYAHTRMALERGMSMDEIRKLLTGDTGSVPSAEAVGIVFAQHYADTRGNPTGESWRRLLEVYGEATSLGILGASRVMMIGNAYGIAWSAFVNRLRGELVAKSSLRTELAMLLSIVFLFPVSLVHAAVAALLRRPIIQFDRALLPKT